MSNKTPSSEQWESKVSEKREIYKIYISTIYDKSTFPDYDRYYRIYNSLNDPTKSPERIKSKKWAVFQEVNFDFMKREAIFGDRSRRIANGQEGT